MSLIGRTVAVSVFAALALIVVGTVVTVQKPEDTSARIAMLQEDAGGGPVQPSDIEGRLTRAVVDGHPIILLRLEAEHLSPETAAHAMSDPAGEPGILIVAYSAKSTHLGCSVDWLDVLFDGRGGIIDPCHHGIWDAYDLATPREGTPTRDVALPIYEMEWGTWRGATVLWLVRA